MLVIKLKKSENDVYHAIESEDTEAQTFLWNWKHITSNEAMRFFTSSYTTYIFMKPNIKLNGLHVDYCYVSIYV